MSDDRVISRRAMLRGGFLTPKPAPKPTPTDQRADVPPGHAPDTIVMRYPQRRADAAPRPQQMIPVFRPPGAVDEATFLDECTRCAACIEACPHEAVIQAPERLRRAAGTPVIDPDRSPCRMCDDLPCVAACEPDVLSLAAPVLMGTARITPQTCLAHQPGPGCTVCSEQCPVEGAIEVVDGRPRVVESACTGCGVCRYVCPAPENAILLMPTLKRPPRTSGASDA